MNKTLILLRGLPGSGKSTLGNAISPTCCVAADDYFDIFCNGEFIAEELKDAHEFCRKEVEVLMATLQEPLICVTNTFTQEWEMQPYLDLAKEHGYTVHTIIVENRHGNESIHNVPKATVEKMRKRFEVKL